MISKIVKITVPNLGDFRDVPIVEIPVSVGDVIAAGDTVVVVESDKATLDVPAEAGGRVTALHVGMGDKVSEGAVLVDIEVEDGPAAAAAPRMEPETVAKPATPVATSTPPASIPAPATNGLPPHASPSIRKFAREQSVDLTRITGSGPKGRITREDVQGFVKAALQAPAAASGCIGLGLPDWPRVDFAKFSEIERKPLSRIVRISGPALARNAIMIPHVTNFDAADVTDLEAFRKAANADKDRRPCGCPSCQKIRVSSTAPAR